MRLILMRHAQAEPSYSQEDIQRALTENGRKQAEKAASFLNKYQIDKMLVSYVKRTMQTSTIISNKIGIKEVEIIHELYNRTDEDGIIDRITSQEDYNNCLLILGHNPLIHNLALSLSDKDSAEYGNLTADSLPTSGIVVINFNDLNNWQDINLHKGKIIEFFKA